MKLYKNLQYNNAFTLAEILIVLAVIGVISSITVPALMGQTSDKELVARVKRSYSALTEAFDRAEATYGPFYEWSSDLEGEESGKVDKNKFTDRVARRITKFMNVQTKCNRGDSSCNEYYDDLPPSFIMTDDSSLAFSCKSIKKCEIVLDVNGPAKGKFKKGYDVHFFNISKGENGFALNPDVGKETDYNGKFCKNTTDCTETAFNTAWIIKNGNADYLKCAQKLNWDTKIKCD